MLDNVFYWNLSTLNGFKDYLDAKLHCSHSDLLPRRVEQSQFFSGYASSSASSIIKNDQITSPGNGNYCLVRPIFWRIIFSFGQSRQTCRERHRRFSLDALWNSCRYQQSLSSIASHYLTSRLHFDSSPLWEFEILISTSSKPTILRG